MTNLKELRTQAKTLNITGAWDMNKAKLEKAIKTLQMKPKTNAAGNQPWQKKLYYVDAKFHANLENAVVISKAPKQVRDMLTSMLESNTTNVNSARDGTAICNRAKEHGLTSKIPSPNLFAYYRKAMENLGLVFAGYASKEA